MATAKSHLDILVVEDNQSFCEILSYGLRAKGHSVTSYPNARAACDHLGQESIDLIISDIKMPGMNGIEFLHRVKKNRPEIPVILITGFNDIIETQEAYELGAKGFLAKPFNNEQLHEAIITSVGPDKYQPAQEQAPRKTLKDSTDFFAIPIENFISGKKLQFTIYLALSKSKLVKVANSGEDIPIDQIEKFRQKGILELYIENKDVRSYFNANLKITGLLSKTKAIDQKRKIKFLNASIKQIQDFTIRKDLDPELYNVTQKSLEHALDYLAQTHDGFSMLEDLIKDCESLQSHTLFVSFLSTLIARQIGWTSPQRLLLVALGGFFHDIGLSEIPEEICKQQDKSVLSPEDFEVYQQHPLLGEKIIQQLNTYPEGLDQIVAHHHERSDGSGFPNGYGKVKIHPVAKIIGLADEFAHILNEKKQTQKSGIAKLVIEELQRNSSSFEHEHIEALVKIFEKKKITLKKVI